MQFDAIKPGIPRPSRTLRKRRDDFVDVGDGHAIAFESVQRILVVGRTLALRILQIRDIALATAMTQLEDVPALVLVNRLTQRAPRVGRRSAGRHDRRRRSPNSALRRPWSD